MLISLAKAFLASSLVIYFHTLNAWTARGLTLHFNTTDYNYSAYAVEVKTSLRKVDACSGNNETVVWRKIVPDRKPSVFLDIPKFNRRLFDVFCIEVTPAEMDLDGKYTMRNKSIFQKKIVKPRQEKCGNVNPSLNILLDTTRKTITAVFGTEPCRCFSELRDTNFIFYRLQTSSSLVDCSDTTSDHFIDIGVESQKTIRTNCSLSEVRTVQPGNYCVTVQFTHRTCKYMCRYATEVRTLHSVPLEVSEITQEKKSISPYSLLYLLIIPTLAIVLIVLHFLKCKNKLDNMSMEEPFEGGDDDLEIKKLIEDAEKNAKKLEVVILFFHEFEEHDDAVVSLQNFFLKTWKIGHVRMDLSNEAEIAILGPSYMETVTATKPNRRIIVVESKGAVLQDEARQIFMESYDNDDFLNEMFQNGLQLLRSDCRSLFDYKNLFVVRFGPSLPEQCLASFVPNRRYILPRHLIDLYCSLVNVPQLSIDLDKRFKEKMKMKWTKSLEQDLLRSINAAVSNYE